jgi:DNA-directed RNA polymerase subunit H (RpoH/RPB5)
MNNMIDGFNKLNDFYNLDIDIYSISCENLNKERKEILKSFSENDDKIQLLFNIKILNECIDIPSCDSIYISYPSKNKITTIQRINRATRINKNNPYKVANIYIWCDEYEEILETLSSIKEYDIMFKDKIKINTLNFYHNRNDKELKLIENDKILLSNYILGVKEFKCLTWNEKLAQVEEYIIENQKLPSKHNKNKNIIKMSRWIVKQKFNYINHLYLMKNNEIKKKFEEFLEKYKDLFKTNEEIWFDNLKEVEEYILTNSKLPSNLLKDKNIKHILNWIYAQKQNYKNKKKIMKNNEIRKEWEQFIEKYNELFKSNEEKWIEIKELVEKYIIENKKLPSYHNKDKNSKYLYNWLSTQQQNYKNKKDLMKNDKIRKEWEQFIEKYNELFKSNEEKWIEIKELVEKYIIENKKLPSYHNKDKNNKYLYKWLSTQQQNYKNKEQIMKNDKIRKEWEQFIEKYNELFKSNEELWTDNLKKLEEFINKYNKLPSKKSKDIDIKVLSIWLSTNKQKYKNNKYIMKNDEIRKEWEDFIEKYSVYMN